MGWWYQRNLIFLFLSSPLWVVWLGNIFNCMMNWKCWQELNFLSDLSFLMLLWWSVFYRAPTTEGRADLMNHHCGYVVLREVTKIPCQSLMMWLNSSATPFQDKLKCGSHCGPRTGQINRITEKEWPFLTENWYDTPPPFFPEILKAFFRETLAAKWNTTRLVQ